MWGLLLGFGVAVPRSAKPHGPVGDTLRKMQPRLYAPSAPTRSCDCLLPLVLHVVILSSFAFPDDLVGLGLDPDLSFDFPDVRGQSVGPRATSEFNHNGRIQLCGTGRSFSR